MEAKKKKIVSEEDIVVNRLMTFLKNLVAFGFYIASLSCVSLLGLRKRVCFSKLCGNLVFCLGLRALVGTRLYCSIKCY